MKPRRLKQGDTIGIIAPASPAFSFEKVDLTVRKLEDLGYKVVLGESCYKQYGFLSGVDEMRAKDFNVFFEDDKVDAIFCLRGGYGSNRIVDMIDFAKIKLNPKIFLGFSDITYLLNAIYKFSNLVTFHGPMIAAGDFLKDYNFNFLMKVLKGDIKSYKLNLTAIVSGQAEGKIIGGNLSIIASMIGTAYEPKFDDGILILEDVGEEPYKIDRLLYHLKYSNVFKRVKAVILGDFTNCEAREFNKSLSINEVLWGFFSNLNIPVYILENLGHGEKRITIPIGIKAMIKDDRLMFMEEGVTND
ncbi:putative murein peptide carboxypeptidase [Caloramator mitchellensis]|uniref:Putative murein peptide carboxypeptidase n=1 Tax=Caloramator mitchellensis TaxID=908809 RepID=A0A0R3JVB8_CALMK|nr:LD-carboxypeptidase [Caloramator mitchellensis]KRQ87034.1 putative murein peptide carboxypeptidase [Caloramator mitchellensis]